MEATTASGHSRGPPRRPINKLLIANRGEIAKRIIDCARELSIETYALITTGDMGHALGAAHVLPIPSPATYLDISALIQVVKQNGIDAVHPGYGFLSESADFAQRMWDEAGAAVIGPGWDILSKTADKITAKLLAKQCGVPTLPAMDKPTVQADEIRHFAAKIGLPIMLKAVDGGGGKGIRVVRQDSDLENAMRRAIAESPSHRVFVEKAAVDGFRHIEVQIVGDGSGQVRHLWERECSIQRRYQKIVEQAPSTIKDRKFVGRIIEAAIRMARHIRYLSLGTFEFLANADSGEFFFLEVNPRLQVEHTIAQGAKIEETGLRNVSSDVGRVPNLQSIQLRVTAENVQKDWTLSIGRVETFSLPAGQGVRVDTHLNHNRMTVVGADYDSLLAKLVVTGESQKNVLSKCRRALEDTWIKGVNTNLDILRAIVTHQDFERSLCDTSWLEQHMNSLLVSGLEITHAVTKQRQATSEDEAQTPTQLAGNTSSAVMLRRGDAWALRLTSPRQGTTEETHHVKLTRVVRNELPSLFKADIEYSHPQSQQSQVFTLEATSTNASSSSIMAAGKHRRGDITNPHHVVVPFPGKLIELSVEEGDIILPGQVVCVVQQMKMELEVRSTKGGRVKWVTDTEDGEDIAEGTLAAELEDLHESDTRARL
ncbi:PycA protein [Xylaria palmicola]|nr:PycA protein [Xylaria palmicola]